MNVSRSFSPNLLQVRYGTEWGKLRGLAKEPLEVADIILPGDVPLKISKVTGK